VPYALRAAVAESVEGSTVDANEVSIGGNVVIDGSGNWLGTPPDWSDLTGVPADLADGDADTLLGLPCAGGYVAKYSPAQGAWDCAEDNDSLATLICLTGEIPVYDVLASLWVCGADLDTDTQLTEAQVDALVANNGYSVGPHTPDTDTQLTEAQVDAFVANNGYSVGAHTAQLTEAQVDTFVANNGYSVGAHTAQLTEAQVDTFVANNGYSMGAHTTNTDVLGGLSCAGGGQVALYDSNTGLWTCGADAVLSEAQVENYITNGALALSGDLTVDTSTLFVDSVNNSVGIGTTSPTGLLHVLSPNFDVQSGTGNTALRVENKRTGEVNGATIYVTNNGATTATGLTVETKGIVGNTAYGIKTTPGWPGVGPNHWTLYLGSQAKSYFAGKVGIGTPTPSEELTVTGTIESTSGGFKFPDGSTQASAASSGPGTIIYTRCAWSVNSYSQIGTCTPPACPTGWSDLGISGNVKTESTDYGYHNSAHPESAGYQERTCHSATTYLVAVTRCSWSTGSDSTIGSCTPPPCSSGWTDLGTTGNVKTAVMGYGYWNSNTTHSAGYQERTCNL